VDFRVQKNSQLNKIFDSLLLDQLKSYSRKNPTQESCGIIIKENNLLKFIECDNNSINPSSSFVIDSNIIIDYDVEYIFHSHIICSANPSIKDIDISNELCIPFLIYSLKDDDFYLYDNISV
jgi:proteasome lid subunit RPN8/RPN11